MATYAIGDVQGCYDELCRLLDKLRFDPVSDRLWFCGDLVNRGGQSLEVLRLVKRLKRSALVVLGNHDLALLALAERKLSDQQAADDDLKRVLFARDREPLLDWLRQRPLLHVDHDLGFALVHAGLAPTWSLDQAERIAREVEAKLRGKNYRKLLLKMFGNRPPAWSDRLRGFDRWRVAINVLTRMRFCAVDGNMAFSEKGAPGSQRPGLYPWYEVPGRVNPSLPIICGHWSTLGLLQGMGIHAIDTGCVWGGALTALRIDGRTPRIIQVKSAHPVQFGDT